MTTPFANFRYRENSLSEAQYDSIVWCYSVVLTIVFAILVVGAGVLFSLLNSSFSNESQTLEKLAGGFFWAGATVPFLSQAEFFRRCWLVKLQSVNAFLLDSFVWLTSVAVIVALYFFEALTLPAVFAVLTAFTARGSFFCWNKVVQFHSVSKHDVRRVASRHWKFGHWILFSESLTIGKTFGTKWILVGFLGLGAVGIYEACHSLLRAINPFFLAVANVAEPLIAKGYAKAGRDEVRRIAMKVLLVMLAGTIPICLAIGISAPWLLELLYSNEVSQEWPVVVWLAATGVVYSVSFPFSNSIQAIGHPKINFFIRLNSFFIVIAGSALVAPTYHLVGVAAMGTLGSVVALLLRLYFFFSFMGRASTAPGGDEFSESKLPHTMRNKGAIE